LVLHRRAELGDFFAGFPPSTHESAAEIDGAMAAAAVSRAWSSGLFVIAGVAAFTAIGAWLSLAWQRRNDNGPGLMPRPFPRGWH
jgi:hypothetical protein